MEKSIRPPSSAVHTLAVREQDGAVVARCTVRFGEVHPGATLTFTGRDNEEHEVVVVSAERVRKHVDLVLRGDAASLLESGRFLFGRS